jgi:hypothetical protein
VVDGATNDGKEDKDDVGDVKGLISRVVWALTSYLAFLIGLELDKTNAVMAA